MSEFFEAFFALIPDLAAIMLPEGVFTRVNPAWERMLGYSLEELVGMRAADLIHPDDLELTLEEATRGFAGIGCTGFINRYCCKDGSYKWIEWEAAPAPDNSLVFATGRDITERKRAQEKLEDQDRQLSTIYSSVSDVLFLLAVEADDRFRYLTVNRRFLEVTGFEESQVVGKYLHEVIPESSLPKVLGHYRDAIAGKTVVHWEEASEFPAGIRCGEVHISPIFDENGRCTNLVGTVRDQTERARSLLEKQKLEEQLRQAQKLESIGRLAGGVAHDFNNLLTVIQGYSELLQKALSPGDPLKEYSAAINAAGERAAKLTSQLLAFSRKQVIKPKPLDLNRIVSDTKSMLQSLIGEDILLITRLDPSLGRVMADSDQIHQVLMNLAANARDAMPHGGALIIESTEVVIDESYVRTHPEATVGHCVLMTVNDSGCGMDDETRQNVFEPFFTTKGPGKGTGLGLATVYGIVHQFNGWIDVESGPGKGTTFRIYLPRLDEGFAVEPDPPIAGVTQSGSGTILLVEDEEAVRGFIGAVLTARGYSVIPASSGAAAIDLAARHMGTIHLMISDVVMPGMNGRELADRLKVIRPHMKVMFISGYTADVIVHRGVFDYAVGFLAKPFSPAVLAAKVSEILTGEPGARTRAATSPESQHSGF